MFLPSSKYRKFNEDIEQFIIKELDFDPDVKIHADYIWNGRDDFEGLSMGYRAEITETISKFLGDSTLTRFYAVYRYKSEDDEIKIYKELLNKLVQKCASYISKQGGRSSKQLLLIFDRRVDKREIHDKSFDIQHEIAEQFSS